MFVSTKGSPYAGFRRALVTNSPALVTAAALELPRLTLADALRVCLVYARTDRQRFDRAIVRWHARFCLEAKHLDAPTVSSSHTRKAPATAVIAATSSRNGGTASVPVAA